MLRRNSLSTLLLTGACDLCTELKNLHVMFALSFSSAQTSLLQRRWLTSAKISSTVLVVAAESCLGASHVVAAVAAVHSLKDELSDGICDCSGIIGIGPCVNSSLA